MKNTFKKIVLPIVLLSAFSISFFSFTNTDKYFDIAKNLDIFATLYKEINTYYVDEVDPNQLIKIGIDAMLKSLDPYTNYIPEDKIEDYRFMTTGQYGGIGAVIGKRKGETTVLSPYVGFPAEKAGLLIGDVIKVIDDIDIKDKNTNEVSQLLKGQAGTKLTLQVKRFGIDSIIHIDLIRERIKVDNVTYSGMITDEIGYIALDGFTQTASKEVKDALAELKKQGAKKLVFDLRENGGGLLNMAIDISNIFIPKGKEVVSTRGKMEEWNKVYNTTNVPEELDMPLVVLTNGGSASASEIVSGVMQDYDRGVLIGRTTYGKGLVQATRPLSYKSQLKVTTAKYYIPSGRCIQALDYSNKVDGKAQRTEDSARVAFKTQNGRLVYDGKGLNPDIEVTPQKPSDISVSLINKFLIFDYATEYRMKYKTIAKASEFKLSEEEFSEFVAWLKDKDYDYKTEVEKALENVREKAKEEKLLDKIDEEIKQLEAKVSLNKNEDLQTNKEEIIELLENEIVKHYYFNKGSVEATFDDDKDIQEAIKLLNDDKRYKGILAGDKS